MSTPGHHHQGFKQSLHAGAQGSADHVIWKPCFFACVRVVCCSGDCGTVSPLHTSEVGCANTGLLRFAVVLILWCNSQFFSTQSLVCKSPHDSQQLVRCLRVGKSLVRAARRIGRRRVKWPRRRPRYPRMRVRMWARKVVLWITPSGGKDANSSAKTPSLICGEEVNPRQN